MSDHDSENDYTVGYKRPPKATQFKPGQSGNRKGRPKGARNFVTELERELNAVVPITENGVRKTVRKKQIIAKQLVNKAAAGDVKATTLVLNETRLLDPSAVGAGAIPTQPFLGEDETVLSSILKRMREYADAAGPTGPEASADVRPLASLQSEEGPPS
jgi:hypothetical protein